MKSKKQVLMVMPVMKGGGAERVAALLMNEFDRGEHEVSFLLTSSTKDEVIQRDLNPEIPLIYLKEEIRKNSATLSWKMKGLRVFSSCICRFFESLNISVPAYAAYLSFVSQYKSEITQLRRIMQEHPDMTVISFLQPSIPIVVLAARGLPNKIIISERGNPERLMKHRYGKKFIEKYYSEIDTVVFQTEDAKNTYPTNISKKGVVIPNPIKSDLPMPYTGERNKCIMTFCRISIEKNLDMLIKAFIELYKEYPEYKLRIIGDSYNEESAQLKNSLMKLIEENSMESCIEFQPFISDVHREILKDAMYINSSNYEGMSNAMLEAMAIGMPVICTDCPIGGARYIIEHEVNGILVPVNDSDELYHAMKKIIEDKKFCDYISGNAVKIRQILSLDNIAARWMELI